MTDNNTTSQPLMESMLTTVDNPFNPFTEFKAWFSFDVGHGYHTLDLLGRILISSNELSDADELLANELAIDEILNENVSAMHRRVMQEVKTN